MGVLSFVFFVSTAWSYHFLYSAEHIFFRDPGQRRFGIEIEFKGLTLQESCESMRESVRGTFKPVADSSKECRIDSPFGDIVVKIEANQLTEEMTPETEWVTEVVLPPLTYSRIKELQPAMRRLQLLGAKGTSPDTPVSIQVNMEFDPDGKHRDREFRNFLNLLKNYVRESHRIQVTEALKTPSIRKPYLMEFTPGFLRQLRRLEYQPSPKQLHFDILYRQSLELLGDLQAWSLDESEVRRRLLAAPYAEKEDGYPIIPEVIKTNILRYSSLLMYLVPDDDFSEAIAESEWAVARPLIEFREPNNDFDIVTPVKWVYGLLAAAEDLGVFDHDQELRQRLGLTQSELERRRDILLGKTTKPLNCSALVAE